MEKLYTINDLALFSGLSTRTLRNYIKSGLLSGEKIDGIWKFTAEEVDNFISNPNVRPSILAKNNATVYDFMLDTNKKTDEICTILDLHISEEEAAEVSAFFCNAVNNLLPEQALRFSFNKSGNHTRVILKGTPETILEILTTYYN